MDIVREYKRKFLETGNMDYLRQALLEYGKVSRDKIAKNMGVNVEEILAKGVPAVVTRGEKVYRGYIYQDIFYYRQQRGGDIKQVNAKKVGAQPYKTGKPKTECAPAGVGTAEISSPSKVSGHEVKRTN